MAIQRNTMQKDIIRDIVTSMYYHPTAEDVYNEVHQLYSTISRATVFRVLNQLSENGEIRKVKFTDGADRYDFRLKDHFHIKCVCCNKIKDINLPMIYKQLNQMTTKDGYKVVGYQLCVDGICPDCQSKAQA